MPLLFLFLQLQGLHSISESVSLYNVLIGNSPLTQKDNEFARMQLRFASIKGIPLNECVSRFLIADVVKRFVDLKVTTPWSSIKVTGFFLKIATG